MDYRFNPFDVSGSMEQAALSETGRGLSIADPITAYLDRDQIDPRLPSEPQSSLEWSGSLGYPRFGETSSLAIWGEQPPGLVIGTKQEALPTITEEDIQKGGVLTPGPDADASEKIKASYENRSRNIGNPSGQIKVPEMPTMKEQSQRIQQEQSKQILFDQTKIPAWHESSSFYNGLLSMGLNLLAGNDIATAFNQGAQVFDRNFGIEKRQAWAEDLRAYGYDDLEIMKYIETGDNKVLTDPMERKRQARRDAMEEAKLRQMEYETSPEMQQYQMEKDQFTMGMQVRNAEQAQANADRAYALQEAQFMEQKRANTAREKADAAKTAAGGKYDPSRATAENHFYRAQSGLKNYNEVSKRTGGNIVRDRMFVPNWLDNTANAKVVDLALSGDPVSIDIARKMGGNDVVETLLAEKEWLSPVMRKDSGAAVSHSEWNNMGNIYFPRPNDSPEKLAMKAQAREVVTMSMNPNASPELRRAVDAFSNGALPALRLVNGQAYAGDGKGRWKPIPMSNF